MNKYFKLDYTSNISRRPCSRIIKARDIEDAKLWFENHLDNKYLLDGILEVTGDKIA